MKDSQRRAMFAKKRLHTYGFLTTKSYIVEVKAQNPKVGYDIAVVKLLLKDKNIHGNVTPNYGNVTPNYQTYDKTGFAPVGKYRRVKEFT